MKTRTLLATAFTLALQAELGAVHGGDQPRRHLRRHSRPPRSVARVSLDRIIGSLVPFVPVVPGCLTVVTFAPALSLFVRDLLYK